jgi:hypothetical protein
MLSFLFKKKSKGCLHGKTEQQKIDFFDSLCSFATKDKQFFEEQYWDLQKHERKEFSDYVIKRGKRLQNMKGLVEILSELIEKK